MNPSLSENSVSETCKMKIFCSLNFFVRIFILVYISCTTRNFWSIRLKFENARINCQVFSNCNSSILTSSSLTSSTMISFRDCVPGIDGPLLVADSLKFRVAADSLNNLSNWPTTLSLMSRWGMEMTWKTNVLMLTLALATTSVCFWNHKHKQTGVQSTVKKYLILCDGLSKLQYLMSVLTYRLVTIHFRF